MKRHVFAIVGLIFVVPAAADGPKPKIKDPDLRAELLRRMKADQDARGAIVEWMKQNARGNLSSEAAIMASLDAIQRAELKRLGELCHRVDEENTRRLGQIVERQGWPTFSLVGKDGAKAAWILVQHADHDPKFQRKCLELMKKEPHDQIFRDDLAYLTDRVLLAEGKKQVYGTQFDLVDGKCRPRPLEDPANVDRRRKDVGLSPLAEYLRDAERAYTGAPSGK